MSDATFEAVLRRDRWSSAAGLRSSPPSPGGEGPAAPIVAGISVSADRVE